MVRAVALLVPRATAARKITNVFLANVKTDFAHRLLVEMPKFKLGKIATTEIPSMMAMVVLRIACEMMFAAMESPSHFMKFVMTAMLPVAIIATTIAPR